MLLDLLSRCPCPNDGFIIVMVTVIKCSSIKILIPCSAKDLDRNPGTATIYRVGRRISLQYQN